MMTPPKFWQEPDGARHPAARLLWPVAALYGFIGARKISAATPYRAAGPVICVGNVSMGGVGKTPFSLMLAETLQDLNRQPAFLTRGFGGSLRQPTMLGTQHTAAQSGDEAQLLRQQGPVVVAADRPAGARLIFAQTSADSLIMDDGFQNPSLHKDLSFLLIDAETGFGNGQVFPAGPLREKPAAALRRAQAVVFVLPDQSASVPDALVRRAAGKPVLRAWLEAAPVHPPGRRVVAFCGIGRPEKFYRTARSAGYDLAATRDFPDHHAFTQADLTALRALAGQHQATLLTTQKDHVRLPTDLQAEVETLPVRMQVDKQATLTSLLEDLF